MTPEYVSILLDFHYWARDRMLAAVAQVPAEQYERAMGNSFSSLRATVNHTYHAEWIWYRRWHGVSPSGPAEPRDPDLATLMVMWFELESDARAFVGALDATALAKTYDYRNMAGVAATSQFWEMFVHVVNHATYHRGQVTTLLRQLGAKPPESTDMITFFRARAG